MSIVIVTGGSRGLGASIAAQCAKRGMGVILTYNSNRQAAEKVVGAIKAGGARPSLWSWTSAAPRNSRRFAMR